MRQISLVALYGTKNGDLEKLTRDCQQQVLAIPNIKFRPYELEQIHATIVSLERLDETDYNLNFFRYRNRKDTMDFDGLLQFIRESNYFPFQVQMGGFINQHYPFRSREQTPFKRSFQISNDKVILIGWPVGGGSNSRTYPDTLDKIRRSFQEQNILHTYHQEENNFDNDFYFRLGIVDPASLTVKTKQILESNLRAYLASCSPLFIEITTSNVYIACYNSNELPADETRVWPVSDPIVTSDFMRNLFSAE